jgi:D-sedoheptulose 7-phosphate isomerase
MDYLKNLIKQIKDLDLKKVNQLYMLILKVHKDNKKIFICGNGGSAANAEHVCNDLMLGFKKNKKKGFKVYSLTSNKSVLTCIANDISYNKIYSHQLDNLGNKGDLLIAFSGSGNSKNILECLKIAKKKNIHTFSILGFSGGHAKKISNNYIHININDMEIAEDIQMVIFNYIKKKIISSNNVIFR